MTPGAGLAASEARVLVVLLRVEAPVTGRAVARIAGLTQSTAQRALTRLREAGLVVAEPAPPSLLYRANRDHMTMPALMSLLRLDKELRARMAEHVAEWRLPLPPWSSTAGIAREEATAGSDLDVLVVRPDTTEPDDPTWQLQLAELAHGLQLWTGRRASVVEMSRSEAAQGLADREPFLVDAGRDGWLIAGSPLGESVGPNVSRVRTGGRAEALAHLAKAQEFLEAAQAALDALWLNAAVSSAVTAGINAKHALCFAMAGRSTAAEDHKSAVNELRTLGSAGREPATALDRLLGLKTAPSTIGAASPPWMHKQRSGGPASWSTQLSGY